MKESIKLHNQEICKKCGLSVWKESEGKQGNLSVTIQTHHGGLVWKYKNSKGQELSIICHSGSYGREDGLFEIMPKWGNYEKKWGDSVKGYLTFGDVQKWINRLKKEGEITNQ